MAGEAERTGDKAKVATDRAPAVPSYDPALLETLKDSSGKIQAPVKPDDAEQRMQVQKLEEQISKYADRIKEIKAIIDERRGSARNVSSGQLELRGALQSCRTQFQAALVRLAFSIISACSRWSPVAR